MMRLPGNLPPGPKGYPLLGVLPQMRRHVLRFLHDTARQYGDVVFLPMGPRQVCLLRHPDHIAHVFQLRHRHFYRGLFVDRVKPFLGEGLATSEGDHWRRHRRLAQPAFHHQQMANFTGVILDATAAMLERWQPLAAKAEPIEVSEAMTQLTSEIIIRSLFGAALPDPGQLLNEDLPIVMQYCLDRVLAFTDWSAHLPTPKRGRFRRSLRALDEMVYGLIDTHRQSAWDDHAGDFLSMLLSARDPETGQGMSDQDLRDTVMTMFFAGHETSGMALTWIWYILVTHPQVGRRLQAELDDVLAERLPTYADLEKLTYTRMVIQETMRLYPPAWILSRSAASETEIGGYRIPVHTPILISQYLTHRHPDFWDRPDVFDPERFAPERRAGRHRYAYFPFGGGPHQCIGESFAMMEMLLIVAMVAQRYRLRLIPGQRIEPHPILTLRTKYGLSMRLEPARQGR